MACFGVVSFHEGNGSSARALSVSASAASVAHAMGLTVFMIVFFR